MSDGFFETLRTYGGKPALLHAHLARLEAAMIASGYADQPPLEQLASEVMLANMAGGKEDAMFRITVERTAGGTDHKVQYLPIPPHALAGGAATVSLGLADVPGYAYPLKTTSRAIHSELLDAAAAKGQDEVLIADDGRLVEGTRTNVLLLFGDELATPPLGRCLPGVTREALLAVAPGLGLTVAERELTVEDLGKADEVLVSNALIEVRRAADIEGEAVGGRNPDMHLRLLAALLGYYRTAGTP
jgi:branched-subunit amino acid aminotransferase/4-amino-4-deoxychorismate lyase